LRLLVNPSPPIQVTAWRPGQPGTAPTWPSRGSPACSPTASFPRRHRGRSTLLACRSGLGRL